MSLKEQITINEDIILITTVLFKCTFKVWTYSLSQYRPRNFLLQRPDEDLPVFCFLCYDEKISTTAI